MDRASKLDRLATTIGNIVKEWRQPWRCLDREKAQIKAEWQQDKEAFLRLGMGMLDTVIDGATHWKRTLPDPNNKREQLKFNFRMAQFEAALRTKDAVEAAIASAQQQGQDAVGAGFQALVEADNSFTPIAIGELMYSAHNDLNEKATFFLAAGIAEHIRLNSQHRLARHFRSQSKNPKDGFHEELPAALRVAHAERQNPLAPLFEGPFLSAVTKEMTGETASDKDVPFPSDAETGQTLEVADRINPLLSEQDQDTTRTIEQSIVQATDQSIEREGLLALAAHAHLSTNERQIFDLLLEDTELSTYGGNIELGQKLGRSAGQVGVEKARLFGKMRQAEPEQAG